MKKRLFIAVDISDEARKQAKGHIEDLKARARDTRISWTKAENLHLTLKFLGDSDESKILALTAAIEESSAGLPSIYIEISGTGVFPSPNRPKVLWLGVKDLNGDLAKAARSVDEACENLSFPREDRKFSPHLTLGRCREPSAAGGLARYHLTEGFEAVGFAVTEIVLYQSMLSPSGSIYTPLSAAKLK